MLHSIIEQIKNALKNAWRNSQERIKERRGKNKVWISTTEYARRYGKAEGTVRKWIASKKISPDKIKKEIHNNREVYRIWDGDGSPDDYGTHRTQYDDSMQGTVQEAEIIDESEKYELITTYKESFDKFYDFSEKRVNELTESINVMRSELFEVRSENKQLTETLMLEKVKCAQFEAELKIKQMGRDEIETRHQKELEQLKKTIEDKDKQIEELKNKTKWWRKDLF